MSFLGLFGDESSGYKKAMKQFEKYYGEAKGRLTPYGDAGQRSLGKLEAGVDELADPAAFYENIMSGWETSPSAQYELEQAMGVLNNNAAANGLLNSDTLKQALLKEAMGILSKDRQTYYNDIRDINRDYLNQNSSIANLGYGADSSLANLAMSQGQQMGQANINAAQSQGSALTKLLGTILNTGANYNAGGMSGVLEPYTSRGQAELSWLRNTGGYVPRDSYRSSY